MSTTLSANQRTSPYIARERRYHNAVSIVIGLLVFIVIALMINVGFLKDDLLRKEQGIYRTDKELINGGKRFIDYFYSLNSATVKFDQFRSISMILDPKKKKSEMERIIKNDFVRKVELARMKSKIGWSNATANIIEKTEDFTKIEYLSHLFIDNQKAVPFNIILFVKPIKKNDENTDGVGVLSWIDVAGSPFKE